MLFPVLMLFSPGLGSDAVLLAPSRMMWAAGTVAAMSSITFPAVSALVSHCASADQQGQYPSDCTALAPPPPVSPVRTSAGVAQGMITGIRGLCNGLGPALYGFIFFLFNVELNDVQPTAGRAQKAQVCLHTRSLAHPRVCTLTQLEVTSAVPVH